MGACTGCGGEAQQQVPTPLISCASPPGPLRCGRDAKGQRQPLGTEGQLSHSHLLKIISPGGLGQATMCTMGEGEYVGYIWNALEKGYLEHPGSACCSDGMFEIFVLFGRCLFCSLPAFVLLAGAYAWSSEHLDEDKKPVLIRDPQMKRLGFGTTPDEGNLSPNSGFVWMKAGYSESIEWRKVRLTKQRNVDLTTDGLWAMPLNSGWVPVKSCMLGKS